ncbi:MAG TPA: hypothetical protein VNT27_16615 [Propionibacteriaceae bacterium]|nr:hypothetical protein [Propionibacteriaceae bacterium]
MIQRNGGRAEYHELLLVSSVATVVAVRVGLHLSGYPQLGGGGLHIAHLLWGGLAMLGSVLLLLTYLGRRTMRIAAVLGGVGFGLFVDELGKFVTADNDYFFRPALSLIYVCFVLLYLLGRGIRGRRGLNDEERRVNAALDNEEDDVDPYARGKRWVLAVLGKRWLVVTVTVGFLLQALVYVVAIVLVIVLELSGTPKEVSPVPASEVPIVTAAVIAAVCYSALVVVGGVRSFSDRIAGLVWFKRATLLNLLLIQPFHFYRDQISALVGLGLNLAAYAILLSTPRKAQRAAP